MKTTRILSALACLIVLICPFPSHADDTAIYDSSANVNPNVLIIFDNSTSMTDTAPYYDDTVYTPLTYATDTIYQRTCTEWNKKHTQCRTYGYAAISMTLATFQAGDSDHDGIYDSDSTIKRGNKLNYDNTSPGAKLTIAKQAIKQIIEDTYSKVRLGVLLLDGDLQDSDADYFKDTTILSTTYGGSPIQQWDDNGVAATDKDTLKGYITNISAGGGFFNVHYTPLANRLIAAAQYFKHADSTWGNWGATGGLADPLSSAAWCQKNYVIIMTDGLPTREGDTRSNDDDAEGDFDYIESFLPYRTDTSGHGHWNYDYDATTNPSDVDPDHDFYEHIPGGGGSDYLDDVAKYIYDIDLRPDDDITNGIRGKQNITTFVIGFAMEDADTLLSQTAHNGGGEYKAAYNANELEAALTSFMASIIDRAQTFTAPVVPVQRTTSGDKMYISLFTPRSGENVWPGYLVKLKIGDNGELIGFSGGYGTGTEVQVTDTDGMLSEDLVKSNLPPYPYWDAQHTLMQRDFATNPRKIYTYLGTNAHLNNSSNAFNDTNITDAMLASPTKQAGAATGTTAKQDLINYIYGYDAYDENKNTHFDDKREFILGDILHSKPLIIDYDASNLTNPHRVIYVGTNDGMLHAFDDTNGSEKWAFIPPDLLPSLKDMIQGTGHQYYVDGSPQAYILDANHDGDLLDGTDRVIIIFGERGGGTSYCALDVTDPDDPQYLWRVDKVDSTITGIPHPLWFNAELGQSWSEPQIGKVKAGTVGAETDTIVAIIGGGYSDVNSAGRAVYLINVLNGSLDKSFTSSDHASLTKSIPSTVLAADTNFDGYVNRVYVGDLGGQMWRFGNQAGNEDGNVNNWTPRRLFASSLTDAKIFYPPDMALEQGYAYLYFGTGDRENPVSMTGTDRFYALKDKNVIGSYTTLVDNDLVNVTSDELQGSTYTDQQKADLRDLLLTGNGWYITLDTAEKVLAPPTVISGIVLFTTFTPVYSGDNPCSFGGDARLYAVDYLYAISVIDFDGDHNLEISDISKDIGQGIPTEVVITITDTGETRGYIGAGGGIIKFDLTDAVRGFQVEGWREVF